MTEEIIKGIISKYEDDILILDSFLQWTLNPTSMTAGYGIDANYWYIERNLSETYNLSDSECELIMDKLKNEINKILEYKENKYSIGKFRKSIKNELSKEKYVKTFQDFYVKKIKKSDKSIKNFLKLYLHSPAKVFLYLCVQYNAIYGKDINIEKLTELGLVKPLLWISSGTSRDQHETVELFPFLERIATRGDNRFLNKVKKLLGLNKWFPKKPNIEEYFEKLIKDKKFKTFKFIWELYRKEKNLFIFIIRI